jgi:hypothetical protein
MSKKCKKLNILHSSIFQISESHAKEKSFVGIINLLAVKGFTNIYGDETETGMTAASNIFTVFVVVKYQIKEKTV